jgi:adenylylsulfate kinase
MYTGTVQEYLFRRSGTFMDNSKSQVFWHKPKISQEDRRALNQHKSCVLWLTGLSASGKSTLANELDKHLYHKKIRSYVLDGDNVRHGLNNDLGFSPEDRKENIRRIGEVAKLFVDAGLFTITAFISPYIEDRNMVRAMFKQGEFVEVYVKCTVEECEKRDPKGLYKKARANEIREFTGVSAPYEISASPEIVVETDKYSIEECVLQLLQYLENHKYI